jgi:hypothetical protein
MCRIFSEAQLSDMDAVSMCLLRVLLLFRMESVARKRFRYLRIFVMVVTGPLAKYRQNLPTVNVVTTFTVCIKQKKAMESANELLFSNIRRGGGGVIKVMTPYKVS